MNSNEYQLKCRVQEGMFENEFIVTIQTVNERDEDTEVAAFINKDELELESSPEGDNIVNGLLKVSVMGIAQNKVSVVLPQSTFANGPVIWVKKELLSNKMVAI
jgi:hypothetical protein